MQWMTAKFYNIYSYTSFSLHGNFTRIQFFLEYCTVRLRYRQKLRQFSNRTSGNAPKVSFWNQIKFLCYENMRQIGRVIREKISLGSLDCICMSLCVIICRVKSRDELAVKKWPFHRSSWCPDTFGKISGHPLWPWEKHS